MVPFRRSWAQECRRSGAPRNLLTNAVVKPKIAAPSEPPGDQNRTPTSRNSLNSKRNLKGRLFQNSSSESELPIRFGREARGDAGGVSPPPADGGQKGLLLHHSRLTLALLSHYTRSALTGCFLAAQSCRRAGLPRKGQKATPISCAASPRTQSTASAPTTVTAWTPCAVSASPRTPSTTSAPATGTAATPCAAQDDRLQDTRLQDDRHQLLLLLVAGC